MTLLRRFALSLNVVVSISFCQLTDVCCVRGGFSYLNGSYTVDPFASSIYMFHILVYNCLFVRKQSFRIHL